MIDITAIKESVALKAAEELDEQIPDGTVQSLVGWALEEVGSTLQKAGVELATVQNTDGDE